MNKLYFSILASHIICFLVGCLFTLIIEKNYNQNEKKDFR